MGELRLAFDGDVVELRAPLQDAGVLKCFRFIGHCTLFPGSHREHGKTVRTDCAQITRRRAAPTTLAAEAKSLGDAHQGGIIGAQPAIGQIAEVLC